MQKEKPKKMCTFDELFRLNYIVLEGIIFSEINLRKKHKSYELYLTNYIFSDKLYFMKKIRLIISSRIYFLGKKYMQKEKPKKNVYI